MRESYGAMKKRHEAETAVAMDLSKVRARHLKEIASAIEADETGEGFAYDAILSAMLARNCTPCGRGSVDAALADLGLTIRQVYADHALMRAYNLAVGDIVSD